MSSAARIGVSDPFGETGPSAIGQPRPDRIAALLLVAPVLATSIFSKFAVSPFGALGLGLGFPLIFATIILALCSGRLSIDIKRAAYYAFMVAVMLAVQVARQESFSVKSVVFMMTVNLLYALNLRGTPQAVHLPMRFFSDLAALIALCGVMQFLAQFVIGERYAFPIENLVPKDFVVSGFHYLNPLSYGSNTYKANGIVLQEPSFLSQMMAIGLMVELCSFQRALRCAVMLAAILVSYSGTGLLILTVTVPVLLISRKRLDLLALLLLTVLCLGIFAAPLRLSGLLDRLSEFSQMNSSASMRFVSWIFLLGNTLLGDTVRLLFGYGSGNFRDVALMVPFPVAEMMHSKMLIEYGLLGFIAYIGFLAYCIFTSAAPGPVKLAVFLMHFMAGAYAEPVVGVTLTLVLLAPRKDMKKVRLATRFVKPAKTKTAGLRRAFYPGPVNIAAEG